ncbi:hypothetical protein HAL013_15010 [Helicobacter ailurogastricus]|uniref:Uncharacterized protein n=1 Tax=Helicobacter ailurogastricus TaxID=1578720 RepID=A0A0K2X653_9HELI|nr:hypothetical protein HAL011_13370 [Helicobacter ailurogastricus]CRF43275.1 hypothetical protein HAL013_15010 [Helicobacter ailurogastricus]CRF44923.1 hypothetical protein HAL09_15480 [Helicobacter ailurogastricus]
MPPLSHKQGSNMQQALEKLEQEIKAVKRAGWLGMCLHGYQS